MSTLHTVTSAAALLSVSPSHLRRTADEMAGILPDFKPLPGQARRFSDNDLRTLQALFTRLETTPGLTRAQLLSELSAPGSEPLIIPDTLPTKAPSTSQDSPGRAIDAVAIPDSLTQSHAALQSLSTLADNMARLEARIEARIDGLQSQPVAERPVRAPDSLSLVAAAVAVGILIAALVAAAVWPQNTAPVIVCIGVALCCLLFAIVYPLRK